MPRKEIEIEITGKGDKIIKVKVREHKIKTLKKMAEEIAKDIDKVIAAGDITQAKDAFTRVLENDIPILFPDIKPGDIEEAYPSEIEALGEAFLDLNFFALKKIIPPLISLVEAGLKGRMMQADSIEVNKTQVSL